MLTIENVEKLQGWITRDGEWEIIRAFDYGERYMFLLEKIDSNKTKHISVQLYKDYNNVEEQIYTLICMTKKIGLRYSDIVDKDRFTLHIENIIHN